MNEYLNTRWEELLNPKRLRPSEKSGTIPIGNEEYPRIPFDSDYSRITLSAPFRRLQDKAQVFPLEKNDFARTRLTHSIEVSGIARSLGVSLESFLIKEEILSEKKRGHIPSILSVAGLIHDIGNPPFGHFGEETIQLFFKKKFEPIKQEESEEDLEKRFGLNKDERADFENFDGNVQSLRLLLRLGMAKDEFSYNLTLPVLASIIKYPKSSTIGNKDKEEREENGFGISYKKFGYFQSEENKFKEISTHLGTKDKRHPLVFLLEAADDIAYTVSDLEDGCKKRILSIDILRKTLLSNEFKNDEHCQKILSIINKIRKSKNDKIKNFPSQIMLIAQECRVEAQTLMIRDAINIFIENHENILNGNFDSDLIESSKSNKLREFFKRISEYNFNNKNVLKSELIGEKVISFLLNRFIEAVESPDFKKNKTKEGKVYSLISEHYKYIETFLDDYPNPKYKKYMLVTDYISGMTDSYALTLYQELKGIE